VVAWRIALVSVACACGPAVGGDAGGAGSSTSGHLATSEGTSTATSRTEEVDTSTGSDVDGSSTTAAACVPHYEQVGCDPWAQDCLPCEKCSWFADDGRPPWNSARCFEMPEDPKAIGEACMYESLQSGRNDCDRGAICVDTGPRYGEGTCVPLCIGTPEEPQCPDDGWGCTQLNGYAWVCLPSCDPLASECPTGTMCGFTALGAEQFVCAPRVSLPGAIGDPCEWEGFPCSDAGSLCQPSARLPACEGSKGCCTLWCDLTLEPDAPCTAYPGTSCQPLPYWTDGVPQPPWEHVGICLAP
jgi:hypothetical protein